MEGPRLTRRVDSTQDSVFCLGSILFGSDKNCAVQSCSLKIVRLKNYVVLGICLPAKVTERSLERWKTDKFDHGMYSVASDKYVRSHIDKTINCEKLSFAYGEGDVIRMQYQPAKSTLTFNKADEKYEMKVDGSKGEKYRLFVRLRGVGDAVELLP